MPVPLDDHDLHSISDCQLGFVAALGDIEAGHLGCKIYDETTPLGLGCIMSDTSHQPEPSFHDFEAGR